MRFARRSFPIKGNTPRGNCGRDFARTDFESRGRPGKVRRRGVSPRCGGTACTMPLWKRFETELVPEWRQQCVAYKQLKRRAEALVGREDGTGDHGIHFEYPPSRDRLHRSCSLRGQ